MPGVADLPQGDSVGKEGPLRLEGLGITSLVFPLPTWLTEPAGVPGLELCPLISLCLCGAWCHWSRKRRNPMDWERPLTFGVLGLPSDFPQLQPVLDFSSSKVKRYSEPLWARLRARICPCTQNDLLPRHFSGIMDPEPRPRPLSPAAHRALLLALFWRGLFFGFFVCFPLLLFFAIGIMFYFWWCFHISSYFSNTPVSSRFILFFYSLLLFSFSLILSIFLCVILCGMWDLSSRARDWAELLWWGHSLKHWTQPQTQRY